MILGKNLMRPQYACAVFGRFFSALCTDANVVQKIIMIRQINPPFRNIMCAIV